MMAKTWNSGFSCPTLDSASGSHFKNHAIAAHAKHTSDTVAQVPLTLEARGVMFRALAFVWVCLLGHAIAVQDYAELLPEEAEGGGLFAKNETTCRLQV